MSQSIYLFYSLQTEGKKANIRALLCSLHTVVWEDCRWTRCDMSQLVSPADVKRNYRKACLAVHPDKVNIVQFWGVQLYLNHIYFYISLHLLLEFAIPRGGLLSPLGEAKNLKQYVKALISLLFIACVVKEHNGNKLRRPIQPFDQHHIVGRKLLVKERPISVSEQK